MPTKTWIGTTVAWGTASNWSPSGVPTSTDDVIFNNAANCNVAVTGSANSINFTGYTGTFSGNSAITISGSDTGTAVGNCLLLSTGMTFTYNGALTFNTSIGGYVTSNGKTFAGGLAFAGGGVYVTQDALTSSLTLSISGGSTLTLGGALTMTANTFTLTAGTINFGTWTHNIFSISSSGTSVRTMNFGTATINVTGNNTTVWNTNAATNLTITGTNPTINFTYSGAVGTRSILSGNPSEANSLNFNVSAGTDIFSVSVGNCTFRNLNFTGFSGSYVQSALGTFYGSLTLSPTQTMSGTAGSIFIGTSTTQSITSNGVTVTGSVTVNSATTTVQNVGPLSLTGNILLTTGTFLINNNLTITGSITLTAGTMTALNCANISFVSFVSNNSNVRTLNMGCGTWTITGSANSWNLATSTNMTLNSEQSRVLIANTAIATVTFSTGNFSYYTLEIARGASTAITNISGSGGVVSLIDNSSTAAHSIQFNTPLIPFTFHRVILRGSAGNLVTMGRGAVNTYYFEKIGRGLICNSDFMAISGGASVNGIPANTWYLGANSSAGTSVGFIASDPPTVYSLLGAGGVG